MSGRTSAIRRSGADRAGAMLRGAVLTIGALGFLLPFYLLFRFSLANEQQLHSPEVPFWPTHLNWSNLKTLFSDTQVTMAHALFNSAAIAITQTLLVLVISGMAGYGLARIPYRFANAVFYVVLATLLIPAAVTFVPSFVMVSTLGWVSTLRGLIIPGLFQAFATFMFRQYFLSFPKELEDAAMIDGCGYFTTYWRVVIPNSLGIAAAIGTITFIGSWNAFLWPLVISQDQSSWTVQIALSTFLTAQTSNLSELFMAATIAILPLLVVFVFLQRWIVEGVERSGINE